MKILLLGASGQVGWELARLLPNLGDVVALDRKQCDLTDLKQVQRVIRESAPDIAVNAAAYTAVDRAEREPEIARQVNAAAPAVIAEELRRTSGLLVHYSTDYVFDGAKSGPYTEEDPPNPLNAYGKSKLDGELAIQESGVAHLIFRTSWVYGARGNNFLLTMLRLFEQRPELRIVADQIGAPSWCRWIAQQTVEAIRTRCDVGGQGGEEWDGIYHMTAGGATSWHGFASAIRERRYSQTSDRTPQLIPIATVEYPTPARRPLNSILSNAKLETRFGLVQAGWISLLTECMSELSESFTAVKQP